MITVAKFYEMMKPILNMLEDGGYFKSKQICELMNQQFPLTNEEIERKLERGRKPDVSEDVQWALLYLTRAGLLNNPNRGIYAITDEGLKVLSENPDIIDASYLSKYESFRTFKQSQLPRKAEANNISGDIITYRKQPTLLIGLGGIGSNIANSIYGRTKDITRISAFSIDTDMYLSQALKNIPADHFISISQKCSIADYVAMLPNARKWFPYNQILFNKTISEGAGQVRAISRLAFEVAFLQQKLKKLLDEAYNLANECENKKCRMRISIITSLVGGTGSGIFIQTALLVKNYIKTHFPSLNVKIHGEFILPSNFLLLTGSKIERRNMEANAYAALKELNAINEHFLSNGPTVKLSFSKEGDENAYMQNLPYDYCFLYDKMNYGGKFEGAYIENAIMERLFFYSADALNDKFVGSLRSEVRKRAENLYGMISTEKIPHDSSVLESDIFRSIINRTSSTNGKRILLVTSSEKLHLDLAQLPQETVFVEQIEPSATEITITELIFGVKISKVEKLKYNSGQYYLSYKSLINELPQLITPHLDKNWHEELHDIGAIVDENATAGAHSISLHKIPEDSFVFISYSSREIETANQLKHILETNGVSCWMAPQSIPAGSDYGMEIPKAIEKCKAFLLLLSDASQKSNWVPKEVGLAIGKGKIVVPFQIDNATIGDAFNFYLTNSQRISAYNRMTEAYQELLARLKDILN